MSRKIDSFGKTMRMEEVEQILAIPMVSGWVARFSGIPLKTLVYDGEAIVQAQINAQKAIDYDALFAYIDALFIPEAFGCSINFLSPGAAEAEPINLQSEADVQALPIPDINQKGRLPLMLDVAAKLVKLPEREVPVLSLVEGLFTSCARIMGTENLIRALIKKRPMIEKLMEKVGVLLTRFGHALEERGIDGLIVADPVGSATMVSPRFYRELVFPHLRHFIEALKIPVILHVCGNSDPILDMMADTGARILSLDQCMDLAAAKQKVAGRCGIGGNVDPINVLLNGTIEDVKQETMKCLQQGGKAGYILMAGCGVPPLTSKENLKAMVETAKQQS
ncbi:MAG TPA: uroporphyrinogen decarboxylase family protein [Syntrophorhabdaceae bacterium]|nr:uroporphyrinogen decarboxylase family protein [Syntrophorhabdaceae bacterium]HQM82537.1 uroporphyrinogen decarboxylase family protein [Syntrophorhabdaceae bacterium]